MEILIALVMIPPVFWFTALYYSVINCLVDYLERRSDRKRIRKEYDDQIKLYIAVLERETDDIEKGYWLARIWNLQQEMRCLKWPQKNNSRTK